MKALFSILIGTPAFILLVFNPVRSMALMNLGLSLYSGTEASITMFAHAHSIHPYNNRTLYHVGDMAFMQKNYKLALWAYGSAIKNSRQDALLRAKYGQTLKALGYDGSFALKEALTLEPNNPVFFKTLSSIKL